MLFRSRRYDIIEQLRLQQKPNNRDHFLRSLKTIEVSNIGKRGHRFPQKHTWLIENLERFYDMWRRHFSLCRQHDSRVSRKPAIQNTNSQQWIYVVDSKESIQMVDKESGKFSFILY